MNDAEINGIANGMFLYLMEQCPEPCDALAIIATLTVLFQYKATQDFPMEEFAEKFKEHMLHLWKNRKMVSPGPVTTQ